MSRQRLKLLKPLCLSGFIVATALSLMTPALAQNAQQDAQQGHSAVASDGPPPADAVGGSGATVGSAGSGVAPSSLQPESVNDVWRLWSLPPARADVGIESIIGSDDRTRNAVTTTYPERAVVLVTFDGGRCSGAMISVNTVLTAGHCVHGGGSSGAWKTGVQVYPGRNGPLAPFGSCRARTLYTVVGWARDRDERYDYGAIKLDCTIGTSTGFFGFFWQNASLVGLTTTIDGYPGDKPLEQWRSVDRARANDLLQVFYQNDTVPGSSGSVVYTTQSAFCTGYCVLAIHAYGVHGAPPHGDHNHGVRITQPVYDNLLAWRNAP